MTEVKAGPPVVKAYTTSGADVVSDVDYEVTMPHQFGVGGHCGSDKLNMHTAYLDPGMATRAHYHLYSDGAGYVLEGELTLVTYDSDYVCTEQILRPGDFMFIPRGVIHKFINNADTRFKIIATYNEAGNADDTGKFYVEPPLDLPGPG